MRKVHKSFQNIFRLSSHTYSQNEAISLSSLYLSGRMCDIYLLRWVGWRWQRTIFFRHKFEILYKSLHIFLHQIKFHCTLLISIKCRLNFLKWAQNYSIARLDLLGWSSGLHIILIISLIVELPTRILGIVLCIYLTQFFCIFAWDLHKNEHQLEFYNI